MLMECDVHVLVLEGHHRQAFLEWWRCAAGDMHGEPLPIHKQTCYFFGRERRVADIPTDHPSCSKQHAILQYRSAACTMCVSLLENWIINLHAMLHWGGVFCRMLAQQAKERINRALCSWPSSVTA